MRRERRTRRRTVWRVLGIALLAMNLRPAVVAVAPLTGRIRAGTGLSAAGVSLLTTLPLICFGAFAVLAPRLGRHIGLERALLVAIVAVCGGVALRLVPGTPWLFLGSAIAGAGIAVENVLLSGLVKRDFASRTGVMMGMYSVMLSGGASAAAGLTVPLGDAIGGGWRPALGLWGVPAAAAIAVWAPLAWRSRVRASSAGASERGLALAVWRLPLAWWVAAYMASQSLVYYSLNAWLPSLLQSHGVSAGTAGAMLATFNLTGAATSVSVPMIAVRLRNQRRLVALVAGLFGVGIVGLLLAARPGAWAWMVVLGLAQGTGISLGLTLFVLRTRSPAAAAELSGMAQTVGYLVAALGPLTVGVLHGLTDGWTASLLELLGVSTVILFAGWRAAAARTLALGGSGITPASG